MISRIHTVWQNINASYWFYPALFAFGALVLAFFTTWLDQSGWATWLITREPMHLLTEIKLIQPALPTSASTMLSLIAGSMLGMTATVFSITIAAVAFASGTYGPRLLNNFMEDRGNQFSLATFIGTFVYSLTILRAVRSEEETAAIFNGDPGLPGFVPQLSLLLAYLFVGISVAVLVYFLHHIPASIRINSVLRNIGRRLLSKIGKYYPDEDGGARPQTHPEGIPVATTDVGYVQYVDLGGLQEVAQKHEGRIVLAIRTGDFVHPPMALARWCPDEETDEGEEDPASLDHAIRKCFALGGMRTPQQDLHFLVDELVEIGLRALSPGVNDPFTAITAIHWLGAATAELGRRDLRVEARNSENGKDSRVFPLDDDFQHYVDRGFGTMRKGVAGNGVAALRFLDALGDAAEALRSESRRALIEREAGLFMDHARLDLRGPELDEVEGRHKKLLARLAA